MILKKRIRLSAMQRVEVWRRWKAGESLHAIGRALGKDHVVIQFLLARQGGIAPAARRRSLLAHSKLPRMQNHAEGEGLLPTQHHVPTHRVT